MIEDVNQNLSSPCATWSSVYLVRTLWPFQVVAAAAAAAVNRTLALEKPSNREGKIWSHPQWMLFSSATITPNKPWRLDYVNSSVTGAYSSRRVHGDKDLTYAKSKTQIQSFATAHDIEMCLYDCFDTHTHTHTPNLPIAYIQQSLLTVFYEVLRV